MWVEAIVIFGFLFLLTAIAVNFALKSGKKCADQDKAHPPYAVTLAERRDLEICVSDKPDEINMGMLSQ